MIFIYSLSKPGTTEIRYVGMSRSPVARLSAHISVESKYARSHKGRWILKLKAQGLRPQMRIIGLAQDHVQASNLERYWIKIYKAAGCQLVNYTDGGGNPRHWSESEREEWAQRQTGHSYFSILNKQRTGQPLKPETIAKLKLVKKGEKHNISAETRAEMGARFKKTLSRPEVQESLRVARLASEPLRIERVREAKIKARGVPLTEEHKRKVSIAVRKFAQTPEFRQKMSEIKKGKVVTIMTDEIKAKISATLKAKFAQGELDAALAHRKQTNAAKGQKNNGWTRKTA